jgi:lipopolysaccharide biosynthesis glycosyltransferase
MTENKLINIGFALSYNRNSAYLKYLITTIAQMLSKSSIDNFFNIYIFANQEIDLKYMFENINKYHKHQNFSITVKLCNNEFINTGVDKIAEIIKPKISRYDNSVYYKLASIKLLPELKKILLFDIDVTFQGDIAEAYDIDNSEYHIIGVPDIDATEFERWFNNINNPERNYIKKFKNSP